MSSTAAAVGQQSIAVGSAHARGRERAFFTGLSIAFLLIALAGFGPSYFFKALTNRPALSPIMHVHGAVFTGWLVLLIAQTSLIATNQRAWHRRLGIAGAVLGLVMVIVGTAAAISRIQGGMQAPGGMSVLAFSAVPFLSIWTFGVLFAAAIALRKHAQVHKRLIMITTIDILGAATARLSDMVGTGIAGLLGFPMLLIGLIAAYDLYSRGRIHPVTLWVGGITAAMQPLRLVIGSTEAWQSFAGWVVGV